MNAVPGPTLLVAGGGIGGLAAALAARRAQWSVEVFEAARAFSDVGAGVQLGPNATRLIHDWGLGPALASVASFPKRLTVRDAVTDRCLGMLPLGQRAIARYGAPYATVHRADLHAVLLGAVQGDDGVLLHPDRRVVAVATDARGRPLLRLGRNSDPGTVANQHELSVSGDALIGADGVWSAVRAALVPLGRSPRPTGHQAYRTLFRQANLSAGLRSREVTVWLGPRLHVVAYPVRGDDWLNLVVLAEAAGLPGALHDDIRRWDGPVTAPEVANALPHDCCHRLRDLHAAASHWSGWTLADLPPVSGPGQMAGGRVALLGDAAHPMLPYLAQGAGMALEDAAVLGQVLAGASGSPAGDGIEQRLARYAALRWGRVARVQRRARRNATIFHAAAPLRWARDAAIRVGGARLLDMPWLYRGI